MSAIRKDRALLAAVLAAIAIGAVTGGLWPGPATRVAWLGDLFLNALKMLVLPLIFCSMVASVTGIAGHGSLRRVALLAFGYYLTTTLTAVSVGLVVVGIVQPGVGVSMGAEVAPPEVTATGVAAIEGNQSVRQSW